MITQETPETNKPKVNNSPPKLKCIILEKAPNRINKIPAITIPPTNFLLTCSSEFDISY